MTAKKLSFIKDTALGFEVVVSENSGQSYAEHTHTGHYVVGIVTEGTVSIIEGGRKYSCSGGEYFVIAPDVCHEIVCVSPTYSLISICIPAETAAARFDAIKNMILGNPEIELNIRQMSEKVYVSPYHFIRAFKEETGLTPHKFQMQCRIRKAQELIFGGVSVADAAVMTGFCDQSHLDRVFKKFVGISPKEYAKSAILSNSGEDAGR